MLHRVVKASLAATLLLCLPAGLSSQTIFGWISGTVTDSGGSAIAAAHVVIVNEGTGAARTETTNDQGFYLAENIPIGTYTVRVDHPGFKQSEQAGNSLVADGRLSVDLRLQVGDATETVEVVAAQSDAINTVSAEVSQVVDLRGQNRYLRETLGGWQLSSLIHLQSGFYCTFGGSTLLGTRVANYVGGPVLLPNPGPNGWINPAAFTAAALGAFGTARAGDAEGPGMAIYNFSVTRFFNLYHDGRVNLRIRADFQNAFNNVNYESPATTVTSTGFGTICAAYPPRNIQLGAKITF